ncbi:hypothetical protein AQUCO_00300763v1 [Aquilegia coerulea]|uniref:Uncharacterized protein n=1 Tax=Aquilegia coerulea TaxID=218851 RepID=A0A2G5F0F3_AQUCA|nr:hypothetical protein AQUCO_00300763v1 [Aquilegia coerulea]
MCLVPYFRSYKVLPTSGGIEPLPLGMVITTRWFSARNGELISLPPSNNDYDNEFSARQNLFSVPWFCLLVMFCTMEHAHIK